MIKEVTGHRSSKALEIYERPTVPQKQALANVLNGSCRGNFGAEVTKMQGGEKRIIKTSTTQQLGAPFMGSLFQGLNNCTVNIAPQNFHVHLHQGSPPIASSTQEEEFDALVQYLPPM